MCQEAPKEVCCLRCGCADCWPLQECNHRACPHLCCLFCGKHCCTCKKCATCNELNEILNGVKECRSCTTASRTGVSRCRRKLRVLTPMGDTMEVFCKKASICTLCLMCGDHQQKYHCPGCATNFCLMTLHCSTCFVCEQCGDGFTPCHSDRCRGIVYCRLHYRRCQVCETHCCKCRKCENCGRSLIANSVCTCRLVGPYSDRAEVKIPIWLGEPKDGVYFGVELEVEPTKAEQNKDETYRTALSNIAEVMKDKAILKSDASLGPGGFEIVTVPATLQEHRKLWEAFFLARKGGKFTFLSWETDRCGMHVHVTRPPPVVVNEMVTLVSSDHNSRYVTRLAGRDSTRFARRTAKGLNDPLPDQPTHHHAVNILPRYTVEVRIFRGTLDPLHFFANLEFVHALRYFCETVREEASLTWEALLSWAAENARKDTYPHLLYFSAKKGFTPPEGKNNVPDSSEVLFSNPLGRDDRESD